MTTVATAAAWVRAYFCERIDKRCRFPHLAHEWRPAQASETFPACVHCGVECFWALGYQLSFSGRWLGPDPAAAALMTDHARARVLPMWGR